MPNPKPDPDHLRPINSFPQLVKYLRDELEWPIESDDFDELTFDYEPEELGLDAKAAVKIKQIKQLRPLVTNQPWGIFFINFEPKRLPVVVLRRILRSLVIKKRLSANRPQQAAWQLHDLLFISSYGETEHRDITFAHFSEDADHDGGLPTLRVLGWDDEDTILHLAHAHQTLKDKLLWPDDPDDQETWRESWSQAFTLRHREVINTAKALAVRLAELASAIRKRVNRVLTLEYEKGPLRKLMSAFKAALIHDLSDDDFADMYAQTITYGLLTARVSRPAGLVADNVTDMVPITNPFLKELMETFLNVGGRRNGRWRESGIDFDELGINDVVDTLRAANMEAVLRDFGDRNPQEDPVIHFYEDFLKEYDAEKRMKRGVFYTPMPVVSFIVRSVDELLRAEFDLMDGLADTTTWGEMVERSEGLALPTHKVKKPNSPDHVDVPIDASTPFVQILDPATGTGTFLVEVIGLIHKTMTEKWQTQGHSVKKIEQLWNEYVPKHLLPRLHGYELLMAPCAIAHMKIGLKLYETGYRFESDERARVYLTNALEPAQDSSGTLVFAIPGLAHEADEVNAIKRDHRFTVVIGNPPYSKMSANLADAAVALVEPFRSARGERIVEKGALALELNLQDDYVKFWGFLSARMLDSGAGVASYITNARYLSAPTLRGLRAHFADSFRRGFFLDLGGQVSERKAVGVVDENVFDIEQGVAIGLLIARSPRDTMDHVYFGRMTGDRQEKYTALAKSLITNAPTKIPLVPPIFRFIRPSDAADEEFESWPSLDRIMPFNSGCIITSRDNLAIDFDREVLIDKIGRFARSPRGARAIQEEIGFSVKAKWKVERCKEEIRRIGDLDAYVQRILYRPFDFRYVFYLPSLLDTPSRPVCQSVFGRRNLVLLTPGVKTSSDFTHAFVSRFPAEKKACSHDRATQMFPLYASDGELLQTFSPNIRVFCSEERDELDAFSYIYAVLHSQHYRSRYGSALRESFPRVPQTPCGDLIDGLCCLGRELVDLHVFESRLLGGASTTREGYGDFQVEKVSYSDETVWIDKAKTRGFQGVPEEVWNFHIGGYQVCEKWLKDRQAKGGKTPRPGRVLTDEDLDHYQKIVVALSETIRIMAEIDDVIEAHGGWPGAFITDTGEVEKPKKQGRREPSRQ